MSINVKHKTKFVLFTCGIGWGIPFALMMLSLRWIECEPIHLREMVILLSCSILGGIFFGLLNAQQEHQKNDWLDSIKSWVLITVLLIIYGLIYRCILLPENLHESLLTSIIFIGLTGLAVILQQKFILKRNIRDNRK